MAPGTAIQRTPTLADVLQEAPALLPLLSAATLKSLLSVCTATHQAVRRHVKILRIPPSYPCDLDIQLLIEGGWRQLEVLELCCTNLDAAGIGRLHKAHWPNLKHLSVAGTILNARAVKQLVKGKWPRLETLVMGNTRQITPPAIHVLQSSNWPVLRSLQLPDIAFNSEAMALLAQRQWPNLQHLDLSCNSMNNNAISQIPAGRWLHLTSLHLGGNHLETAAVQTLKTAAWSNLQSLDVSSCGLNLESAELLASCWPTVHSLNLAHNRLWEDEQPMTSMWPWLRTLNLADTGLTALSESVLTAWSTLESLDLSLNTLDHESENLLYQANFACLKSLTLQWVCLDVFEAMLNFALTGWSLIECLDLSECDIDGTALKLLTTVCWPQLRSLRLANVGFTVLQAETLIKGQWPKLEVLNFDDNKMPQLCMCACIRVLAEGHWPIKAFSIRGNELTSLGVSLLLQIGWPSIEKLDLPVVDYSSICVGTVRYHPQQQRVFRLHEVRWLCECNLQRLTELTFSSDSNC